MSLLCLLGVAICQTDAVKLPDGAGLSVIAVTDSAKRKSWTAAGKPIPLVEPSIYRQINGDHGGSPNPAGILTVVFAIDNRAADSLPSVAFRIPGASAVTDASYIYLEDKAPEGVAERYTAGFEAPFGIAESTDLTIGVSESKWTADGTYRFRNGKRVSHSGQGFLVGLEKEKAENPKLPNGLHVALGPSDERVRVRVKLPDGISAKAYRVVALDKDGMELQDGGYEGATMLSTPTSYWFAGSLASVATVRLETRPYVWTTFRGIRLRPR